MSCCVSPAGTEGDDGVTAIEISTGAADVKETELLIDPTAAMIVTVPCAPAVTRPEEFTAPTFPFELEYVAEEVSSCVEPSLKFPVTVS